MLDKHQREIPLEDASLLALVQEKGEMVEKGRSISRVMEDLAAQHEKLNEELGQLTLEVNTKKLAIFKRVEELAKDQVGEFEIPITTAINDGKLVLIVTEALDEFKDSFKAFDKWHEPVPRRSKKSEEKLEAQQ